jgi:ferredoxin
VKVTVDEDRCRGHGMCLTLCSEVFRVTEEGYALADPSDVRAELGAAVKDAVANCPEQAILEIAD